MNQPQDIRGNLAQFTGSDSFTRWSCLFSNSVLTSGAQYLADACGAFWLMDLIASHQTIPKVRAEEFQTWKLTKTATGWMVTAEDGNENKIASQRLPYSDFPLSEGITLWAARNELGGITIMLPSEY